MTPFRGAEFVIVGGQQVSNLGEVFFRAQIKNGPGEVDSTNNIAIFVRGVSGEVRLAARESDELEDADATELRAEFRAIRDALPLAFEPQRQIVSDIDKERLRALGYADEEGPR